MKKFWKKKPCVLYHIDRIDSSYGNVMIRGWVVDLDPAGQTRIYVCDADGEELRVYQERLIRKDVNAAVGRPEDYESGIHILIDRAVLNTPYVWLTFENGAHSQRVKIRVQAAHRNRMRRHSTVSQGEELDYDLWIRGEEPDARMKKEQKSHRFAVEPLFSIVIPLYNTPIPFLKEIIDSVLGQTYARVELCLADGSTEDTVQTYIRKHYGKDTRVLYQRLKENKGISENTNAALKQATGDFIVFSDHDDVLCLDALYEMVRVINEAPGTDVIYTDEDKINRKGNACFGPHFKPDFSMELLCCNNYICHLFAVSRELVQKTGMLDAAYDGAQDYDFVLRCCEQAKKICHIPKVLYHWRTHPDSTAGNPKSKMYAFEAGRRAVKAHYERVGIDAEVENTTMLGRYRTRFAIHGNPLISILIPNKDHTEDLERCIRSILAKTTYLNYEILIIENNSTDPATEAYYEELTGRLACVRVIRYQGGFNYAAIHNYAVPFAKGEYLVFLNNDTEIITGAWLEELLGICQKPDVGATGAKLYYPDGTIQHAGVILGLCGVASHLYVGFPGDKSGYAGRLVSVQDLCAVTAACMMTKKAAYLQVGGMEETLAVAYNDIDYCMKLRQNGMRIVFTPYAELYHYESRSRGLENTPEKLERLNKEAGCFYQRWKDVLDQGDPYYNKNLSLTKADCSLRLPGEALDVQAWQEK